MQRWNCEVWPGGEPIWLSSVVLEERYAGASVKNRHIVEQFERDFDRAGRVLVPNLKDWAQAGKVLALVAAGYDFAQIGREVGWPTML
jgi:hypothetical protein